MDNMQLKKVLLVALKETEYEMEEIAWSWNGDLPGRAEDRAHQANDTIEAINELRKLLEGFDEM